MYSTEIRRQALQLVSSGWSQAATARHLGVSVPSIRAWVREGIHPASRRTNCFRCDTTIDFDHGAYAYLLGLYLGDGCISKSGNRGVHVLRITCADAWPGLLLACEQAVQILGTKAFRVSHQGCHDVCSYSKHWQCLFPQHGPGRKHERRIALEGWQQDIVDRHPGELLRGLFHSDGCRFTNPVTRHFKSGTRHYRYPRYMFTNESADIRKLCTDTLDALDIAWRYSRANTISVARRDSVTALDRFVGPKY